MIKLYGGSFSRANIVKWYLEELQLPYEFVLVDLAIAAQKQSDYLAINPFGKVPALTDGDFTIWESGAILSYLAGKYDQNLSTPEQLAIANQWVIFANSTLSDGLFAPHLKEKDTPWLLGQLNQILGDREYLTGQFGPGDVAVGSLLSYVILMFKEFDFGPYPQVGAYLARLRAREGFGRTYVN